jgi:hypothetical protein
VVGRGNARRLLRLLLAVKVGSDIVLYSRDGRDLTESFA